LADRKSVEIGHLSAANLTAGDESQIIDPEEDHSVLPVQGAGSFVGFPSFYMQPDKTSAVSLRTDYGFGRQIPVAATSILSV
jgi:hypothetical protein